MTSTVEPSVHGNKIAGTRYLGARFLLGNRETDQSK